MKRIIAFLICIIVFVLPFLVGTTQSNENIIRFHVIANSDKAADQNIKLKVRDEILKEIYPKLKDIKDYNESYEILSENILTIEEIANRVLEENGFDYKSKVYLGSFNFPIKKYGDLIVPPGEYMALRVVLGNGEGKNWWCVMFPPLCFIDITRGKIDPKSEEMLKRALEENSVETFRNNRRNRLELRLKSLEIISNTIKRAKMGLK
ncbi:MAG: stage II sporulation protein R [Caloramator sp.]|nr:stage II sporulation protein R [Caloramator sp.]